MRLELTEFGIKVTNVQPGAVETDFSKVRFKGDEERAATVYAGYEPLIAEDIADAISYCVNAPDRVSIAEICIYPKAQAEPRTIFRNSLPICRSADSLIIFAKNFYQSSFIHHKLMKILHIETSSRNCSVAISDGEELLCLCEEVSENYKQSESLHTFVEWALEGAEISLKEIEAVSLGKGPGSYTGLRIGAGNFSKRFCYGLKVPLIAVNSRNDDRAVFKSKL